MPSNSLFPVKQSVAWKAVTWGGIHFAHSGFNLSQTTALPTKPPTA